MLLLPVPLPLPSIYIFIYCTHRHKWYDDDIISWTHTKKERKKNQVNWYAYRSQQHLSILLLLFCIMYFHRVYMNSNEMRAEILIDSRFSHIQRKIVKNFRRSLLAQLLILQAMSKNKWCERAATVWIYPVYVWIFFFMYVFERNVVQYGLFLECEYRSQCPRFL